MKSILIVAGFGIVAFAGLFFFMRTQPSARTDSLPVVTELPASPPPKADDDPPPRPSPRAAKKPNPQTAKPAEAPPANPFQPANSPYYTVQPSSRGGPVPSRVIIHKTSMGDVTIVLV